MGTANSLSFAALLCGGVSTFLLESQWALQGRDAGMAAPADAGVCFLCCCTPDGEVGLEVPLRGWSGVLHPQGCMHEHLASADAVGVQSGGCGVMCAPASAVWVAAGTGLGPAGSMAHHWGRGVVGHPPLLQPRVGAQLWS